MFVTLSRCIVVVISCANTYSIEWNGTKKEGGIQLHSREGIYKNSDIQHVFSPLDYFLMQFLNEQIELYLIETNNYKSSEKNRLV